MILLAVALAGGLGACLRFVLDAVVRERLGRRSPAGIVLVNVSGSFALGLLTGLVTDGTVPPSVLAVAGTGLLGGYTTFSTAMVDAVDLARAGSYRAAGLTAIGTLAVSVAAVILGLAASAAL